MTSSNFILLKEQFDKNINPDVISNIIQNDLIIREANPKATGKGITIKNIFNALTLHLDEKNRKIYFIKGETKINDATIFFIDNNKLQVLLIELKSNNVGTYKEQILYGKFYSDFIINVLVHKNTKINFDKIEYRGFVFTTGRIKENKRPTKRGIYFSSKENGIYYKSMENNKEYNFIELIAPIDYPDEIDKE